MQVKQTKSASVVRHAAGPDRCERSVKPVERHFARRVKRLTAAMVTPEQSRLTEVEDALLGALMEVHSNRERALDRLLIDLGELSEVPAAAEEARPATFPDDYVDNDFDGLS
jgi:hypothetical protein